MISEVPVTMHRVFSCRKRAERNEGPLERGGDIIPRFSGGSARYPGAIPR